MVVELPDDINVTANRTRSGNGTAINYSQLFRRPPLKCLACRPLVPTTYKRKVCLVRCHRRNLTAAAEAFWELTHPARVAAAQAEEKCAVVGVGDAKLAANKQPLLCNQPL